MNRRRMMATVLAGGGSQSSLLSGLVAYYKLDDLVDATGRGNTLTNNGSAAFSTGKIGNAVNTHPTGVKYLSCADNADLSAGDSDFTIVKWVYLTAKSASGNMFVSKYDASATAEKEYAIWWAFATNRFRFTVSSGSTDTSVDANAFGAVSLNTMYFIKAWKDKNAQTINIQVNNGVVNSVAHTTPINDSASTFRIGAYLTTVPASLFHTGLVDEVGIWKRLLTPVEDAILFNGGSGITHPF